MHDCHISSRLSILTSQNIQYIVCILNYLNQIVSTVDNIWSSKKTQTFVPTHYSKIHVNHTRHVL